MTCLPLMVFHLDERCEVFFSPNETDAVHTFLHYQPVLNY